MTEIRNCSISIKLAEWKRITFKQCSLPLPHLQLHISKCSVIHEIHEQVWGWGAGIAHKSV